MPKPQTTIFSLVRTGGVAGIRPPAKVLDAASLPADAALRIEALLETAKFFSLPAELPGSSSGADGFLYTLTVQQASGRKHTVTFAEASAGDALKEIKRLIRDACA